jgi:hypothetical protein
MHGYYLTFVVTMTLLMNLSSADAQQDDVTRALTLSWYLDTAEIVPYEPLHATLTVRNVSSQPVNLPASIWSTLEFFCAYERESFTHCGHGAHAGEDVFGNITLQPGEMITSAERLFIIRGGRQVNFFFTKPGSYQLKARVNGFGTGKFLVSDIVKIRVKPPSPDDAAAAKLLTETETARMEAARMIQGWERSEVGAALLEKLVAQFPKSVFADHAHYTLGRYFKSKFFEERYVNKREGKEEAVKAFEHFSAVSKRVAGLRTRVLLTQIELVLDSPDARRMANVRELIQELDANAAVAESIGLGAEAAELREKLKSP